METSVLPSRRAAIELAQSALLEPRGPLLITGEAGIGKTWLARRLAASTSISRDNVHVDLTPAITPIDLLRSITHGLGLSPRSNDLLRIALADALFEHAADGRRWMLVLDEAHLASPEVLEEARVLSNSLTQPDGLAAIVLVGRTSLWRQMMQGSSSGLAVRVWAHIHLRPIDVDEATELLSWIDPAARWDQNQIEGWHRDGGGNPGRLIQLARMIRSRGLARQDQAIEAPAPIDANAEPTTPAVSGRTALLPSEPPLLLEEGVIEVGWDSDDEVDDSAAVELAPQPSNSPSEIGVAAVDGRENRSRIKPRITPGLPVGTPSHFSDDLDPSQPDLPPEDPQGAIEPQHIWAERQHGFAPYSQLFSRGKQPKERE